MAAARPSMAAHRVLPQRTPHATTRRLARDSCTARWPAWGSYSRSRKNAFLLKAAVSGRGIVAGAILVPRLGVTRDDRRCHPPAVLAAHDILDGDRGTV